MSGVEPRRVDSAVPRLVLLVSRGCYLGAVAASLAAVSVTASWNAGRSITSVLIGLLAVVALVIFAVGAVLAGLSVVETGRLAGVWAVVAGAGAAAVLLPAVVGDRLGVQGQAMVAGGTSTFGLAMVWGMRHEVVRGWLAHRRKQHEQQVQGGYADFSYTEWT